MEAINKTQMINQEVSVHFNPDYKANNDYSRNNFVPGRTGDPTKVTTQYTGPALCFTYLTNGDHLAGTYLHPGKEETELKKKKK